MAGTQSRPTPPNEVMPEPFCSCWNIDAPDSDCEDELGDPDCGCGEELQCIKWRWQIPRYFPLWVDLHEDRKTVLFHPNYSSGTAVVKGNVRLRHNVHYYWEVKMLTRPYGTDVMVGIGTKDVPEAVREYAACLGSGQNSYGLSYTGAICQNTKVIYDCPGFCKGTIIGVMVDMFHGTLEYYLNREPQGICFTDLRRHRSLYPMICSTAAQSSMRLTYASSWKNSLLITAAKILASSVIGQDSFENMPPGLALILKYNFWIPMPSAGRVLENDKADRYIRPRVRRRRF